MASNNLYIQTLQQNKQGQDFIVGDLHGRYSELMNQLKEIDFDFDNDRLIAVGDLGDRGLESEKVIKLLEHEWFYSVRGNHDQFILDQYEPERVMLYNRYSHYEPAFLHKKIEGAWFFKLDETVRQYLADLLKPLPYGIQLNTYGYSIGISHAGIPTRYDSWEAFTEDLHQRDTRELCLRTRRHAELHDKGIERTLLDIDYTVHGHTCFEKPIFTTFSAFIDTFDKSKRLTILSVKELVERLGKNKDWRETKISEAKHSLKTGIEE